MYASVCETLAPWPPASGGVGWSSLIASPAEQFVCSDSDTARAAEPPTRPPTPIRSQKLPGVSKANNNCMPQLRRQRQPRRPHRPRRARPEKDGQGRDPRPPHFDSVVLVEHRLLQPLLVVDAPGEQNGVSEVALRLHFVIDPDLRRRRLHPDWIVW